MWCKQRSTAYPSALTHRAIRRPFAAVHWWVVAACIGVLTSAAQDCLGRARGPDSPPITVGKPAPDFELPRLTLTTDPNGKSVGVVSEANAIRLSSFRGKRPVCLIMSSYT